MDQEDIDGKELVEGFYSDVRSGRVWYFTGNYNKRGSVQMEDYSGISYRAEMIKSCRRIVNPNALVENMEQDSKWMRERLSELGGKTGNSSGIVSFFIDWVKNMSQIGLGAKQRGV